MITAKSYIEKTASIASVGAKGIGNVLGGGSTIGGHVVSSGARKLGTKSRRIGNGTARVMSGKNANVAKKSVKQNMTENARLSSYKGTGMSDGRKAINNALGNAFGMKNHAL